MRRGPSISAFAAGLPVFDDALKIYIWDTSKNVEMYKDYGESPDDQAEGDSTAARGWIGRVRSSGAPAAPVGGDVF